jgi:acyl-CoA oxidase
MFRDSIGVWGTIEQKEYWSKFIIDNAIIGTYVQTEIGHGTYLRGKKEFCA